MRMHLYKSGVTNTTSAKIFDGIPVIQFPGLTAAGIIEHGFSTKLGGVSRGDYESMNLSFTRGDDPGAVLENFCTFGARIGMDYRDMVFTDQTHTTNVRIAGPADKGKGIIRDRDYHDIDGLITNEKQLPLVTFYADCVPLYFVDPVKAVIGLSHSGWRGTVNRMGRVTVEAMVKHYGCNPADLIAAIGPSICQSCYEISRDVAEQFIQAFPDVHQDFLVPKSAEKYHLDLWKANQHILLEAGLLNDHILMTDICTCCNHESLWSHRKLGANRGSLAAFLMLK